ncbi:unnamed protein product [Boreogadus saida]
MVLDRVQVIFEDRQPIREALQPACTRHAYYTPATTPAPKFQPYPSEQNQPPGAHSPYIMKKGRTRWRQRAPYSYSQRPFLDAPYRQGPHKAPQSNQWSQHIEAAYNQRLREDAPYSQPLQHILFP